MLMNLIPMLLVVAAGGTHTDTSFAVPTGSQLAVHNFQGDIVVRPWGKNQVRIIAEHGARARIVVNREGTSYDVRARGPRRPESVDYMITAPPWMALDVEGVHGDIDIEGWKSDVVVETVNGNVALTGGEGLIRLSSVTGEVKVERARGRLQLSTVEDGIEVHDATGEISAEAVIGDVMLDRVRSTLLEASSVNGDIQFTGWVDAAGRYRFSTHNGDLDVQLPQAGDATVNVSTFSGGFESAFPMRFTDAQPGRNFRFTLGTGKASVDLESFMGTINLRRGEPDNSGDDERQEVREARQRAREEQQRAREEQREREQEKREKELEKQSKHGR